MRAAGAVAVQRTSWPRLFVADNSAPPTALGGANPTPTTQALATRTAERIVTR